MKLQYLTKTPKFNARVWLQYQHNATLRCNSKLKCEILHEKVNNQRQLVLNQLISSSLN